MRDLNNKLITREAQGRSREAWSVPRSEVTTIPAIWMGRTKKRVSNRRADGQVPSLRQDRVPHCGKPDHVIGGADGGRAGPGSRSPSGQTRCINDAVVSGKCINLSGEASNGGLAGLKSAHSKSSVSASNGGDSTDRGVSRGHSVRLAVYESGGCKSHPFRGPGMISKRGGNASLACEV